VRFELRGRVVVVDFRAGLTSDQESNHVGDDRLSQAEAVRPVSGISKD
jgi:hypothetical protein